MAYRTKEGGVTVSAPGESSSSATFSSSFTSSSVTDSSIAFFYSSVMLIIRSLISRVIVSIPLKNKMRAKVSSDILSPTIAVFN